MSTLTVFGRQNMSARFVKLLIGVIALLVLLMVAKTLTDSFQHTEKAVKVVRETVSAVRTATDVVKLLEEEAKDNAVVEEEVWVTEKGDTVPNPYTKKETDALISISYPRKIPHKDFINGRTIYHLIDQSIVKWKKIPFNEIMKVFKDGKNGIIGKSSKCKYNDKWIMPLNEHNGIQKGATIYRTNAKNLKNIKPSK